MPPRAVSCLNGANASQTPYPIDGAADTGNGHGAATMGRILKALVFLAVLALLGLTGYAYLADLTPPQERVTKPVVLDGS